MVPPHGIRPLQLNCLQRSPLCAAGAPPVVSGGVQEGPQIPLTWFGTTSPPFAAAGGRRARGCCSQRRKSANANNTLVVFPCLSTSPIFLTHFLGQPFLRSLWAQREMSPCSHQQEKPSRPRQHRAPRTGDLLAQKPGPRDGLRITAADPSPRSWAGPGAQPQIPDLAWLGPFVPVQPATREAMQGDAAGASHPGRSLEEPPAVQRGTETSSPRHILHLRCVSAPALFLGTWARLSHQQYEMGTESPSISSPHVLELPWLAFTGACSEQLCSPVTSSFLLGSLASPAGKPPGSHGSEFT